MRKAIYLALAVITLVTSVFWSYSVRAANESSQFAPASAQRVLAPAGTAVQVVVNNGIASSAVEGDTVTAVVSAPVIVKTTIIIPPGAQLEGKLQQVSNTGKALRVRINFVTVVISGRSFPIRTEPVVMVAPAQSDASILTAALRTIIGAAVGAGVGASSGDERLLESGLFEGAASGLSVESAVPITVVLAADPEI